MCAVGCGDKIGGEETGVALEWRDGQWVQRTVNADGTADASLADVRQRYEAGKYGSVVRAGKKHLKKFPGDPTCQEACYLAGASELARERYYQAYELFEDQLDRYPGGAFFERGLAGQLQCAEAFLAGHRRVLMGIFRVKADEEAVLILEGIAAHAPGTRMAEQVLLRVADFQFSKAEYESAADSYDRFMEMFPKSVHSAHALQWAAESCYNMYLGSEYDETPLLEAKHHYESLAEQFPDKAAELNVDLLLEDIRSDRAAKIYDSAAFYERTSRPKAAVYYYEQVIEVYPGTPSAERGRQDLARLNGGAVVFSAEARPARPARRVRPADPADLANRPVGPPRPRPTMGPVGAQGN